MNASGSVARFSVVARPVSVCGVDFFQHSSRSTLNCDKPLGVDLPEACTSWPNPGNALAIQIHPTKADALTVL
jgi:hypothetical protein